ncbi:MAG: PT domain-containing protein [Lachnospiraceae bacterium]|nr:PT domain-containing protein [Lachnospiraceae bacterium]
MIKRLAAVTIVCILSLSVLGCKKTGANTPEPTAVPTTGSEPTKAPTAEPTAVPTAEPTTEPTADPEPTAEPVPTEVPTAKTPRNIEIRIVNDYEYAWSEDDQLYRGYYSYDVPMLSDEDREMYPALGKALANMALICENDVAEYVDELVHAEDTDESDDENYIRRDMTPVRADSALVCLRENYARYYSSEYSDGCSCACFDPATGDRLELKDIVTDKAAFVDHVYNVAVERASSLSAPDLLKSYIEDSFDNDRLTFEVGYNYLAVIFNPYEIETHPGSLTVPIPFLGNESMFDPRYTVSAENYTLNLGRQMSFIDDLGNDGLVDEVQIWLNSDMESGGDEFDSIAVYVNGYSDIVKSVGYQCYDANAVFMHTPAGNYLYITYIFDSEDTETVVYKVTSTAEGYEPASWENPFVSVEELDRIAWDIYGIASYDPMNIEMVTREDIIGTNFLTNRFRFDEYLLNVTKNYVYDFLTRVQLTVEKEITLKMIDKATGAELGDYTAAVGDLLIMYDTDMVSYVDFEKPADDSVLVRLPIEYATIDNGDWQYQKYRPVGEEDFEDIFEGIAYYD